MVENHSSHFKWALPDKLEIPPDPLRIRVDFHEQSCVLYKMGEVQSVKMVSAMEIAQALARELPFASPVLGPNVLRWAQSPDSGEITILWEDAKIWKVALQEKALEEPRRFTIPMPGLIFVCRNGGHPPSVFAAKRRPTKESDVIYEAPLCNIFEDGRVCAGNHKFPLEAKKVPGSCMVSFFSPTADLSDRSVMFPKNVVQLWEYLHGKKKYPMQDLVRRGTFKDLM